MSYDPIRLEIYKHLFASVAEEMGVVLRRSAYSPNIKERRDFSCAVFDATAKMIAQAAHIPVHLGSMSLSVVAAVNHFPDLNPGDMVLLNNPYRGGTHLPDITLVTPIFYTAESDSDIRKIIGYVASRAHHADVGGIMPGSMPVAKEIYQEGLIIPPVRLVRADEVDKDLLDLVLANVRTPEERLGDLFAQIACNRRGVQRMLELIDRNSVGEVTQYMHELLTYTERMTRNLLSTLPAGVYSYIDSLDDDGISNKQVPIKVTITIQRNQAIVDFSGSALQRQGSVNAVYAITLSAVFYVFRCLLGIDVPNNAGCMAPIEVIAPAGSVVNALHPAPVAGGNVETSQRIVDVLLGALAQACPQRIPAASQGTMNNLTIGGWDEERRRSFTYYETIGGGIGAHSKGNGASAHHSHMTNTLNTPVEALEYAYPLRVLRYAIRKDSGGKGRFYGGDGIQRDMQVLVESQVTLLTDRRKTFPYGLQGGEAGQVGENVLIREGTDIPLPGKGSLELQPGDILSIRTPGGGGYGKPCDETKS
jgi:N-methylhydantoinase B